MKVYELELYYECKNGELVKIGEYQIAATCVEVARLEIYKMLNINPRNKRYSFVEK